MLRKKPQVLGLVVIWETDTTKKEHLQSLVAGVVVVRTVGDVQTGLTL